MKVIAIERGYDNVTLREAGETFDMPDEVFERRPVLNPDGVAIPGQFHEPPSWFEPVDATVKSKVEAERKATRKARGLSAIDPGRQQADQQAALRKMADGPTL